MKKLLTASLLVAIYSCKVTPITSIIEKKPAQSDSVLQLVAFISDTNNKSKFIEQEYNPKDPNELIVSLEMDTKRYILRFTHLSASLPDQLEIHIGWCGNSWHATLCDENLDQTVNWATTCTDRTLDYLLYNHQGEEHQQYWQKKYDSTISQLLTYYTISVHQ